MCTEVESSYLLVVTAVPMMTVKYMEVLTALSSSAATKMIRFNLFQLL